MSKRWIQLDEALLDAARAAMASASPRPWHVRLTMMGDHWIAADGCGAGSSGIVVGSDGGLDEYDAPFIVAAVALADTLFSSPPVEASEGDEAMVEAVIGQWASGAPQTARTALLARLATLRAGNDHLRGARDAALKLADDTRKASLAADDHLMAQIATLRAERDEARRERDALRSQLAEVRAAGEGMAEDVRRYVGSVYAWARTASDAGETAEESLRSAPTIEAIRDALARWDALAEAANKTGDPK